MDENAGLLFTGSSGCSIHCVTVLAHSYVSCRSEIWTVKRGKLVWNAIMNSCISLLTQTVQPQSNIAPQYQTLKCNVVPLTGRGGL
jgi:hypothetical protein